MVLIGSVGARLVPEELSLVQMLLEARTRGAKPPSGPVRTIRTGLMVPEATRHLSAGPVSAPRHAVG